MYRYYNPNPNGAYAEDCVIRAISLVTGKSWDDVYISVCLQGYLVKNMPSVNKVWGTYLAGIGFARDRALDRCRDCYTIRDFCRENPIGTYILTTGTHVVAVVNGDYYDTWDSGDEQPVDVWRRELWRE